MNNFTLFYLTFKTNKKFLETKPNRGFKKKTKIGWNIRKKSTWKIDQWKRINRRITKAEYKIKFLISNS